MNQPPFTAHDDAPLTLPADTAAKIAAYGMQGVRPASGAVPAYRIALRRLDSRLAARCAARA